MFNIKIKYGVYFKLEMIELDYENNRGLKNGVIYSE